MRVKYPKRAAILPVLTKSEAHTITGSNNNMARTIRTKVYKFDELNNKAKDSAIEKFRNDGIDTSFIYDDAENTVNEFHELFGTKSGRRSWLEVETGHIDDNVMNLKGLRLRTYIINNFGHKLYKGKFYNYKNNTANKLTHKRIVSKYYANTNSWGNYYYSAITKEHSCVLTGVCYDDSILQPVYDFIENYKAKADYYSYMDFDTLVNDCFAELSKDIDNEVSANNEDEAIIETIQANEYEFTADGRRF
jgi:hypothetical protein